MDDRTYIRVHDGMPEHWKVEDLSDGAFRRLLVAWCWCARQRTDGFIPNRKWLRIGSDSERAELIEAGLVEPAKGGVQCHDYLEHQRSRDSIKARSEASRKANHVRHHVNKGEFNPNCDLCTLGPPHPNGSGSESDSESRSDPKLTPPESHSRSEQSRADKSRGEQRNQSVRVQEAEAARWLRSEYGGLTDFVVAFVIDQARARAAASGGPIRHLTPYLKAMRDPAKGGDEADLADIIKAAMDIEDSRDRPVVKAVPDWCGECNEHTRLTRDPDHPGRCPNCHPLRSAS